MEEFKISFKKRIESIIQLNQIILEDDIFTQHFSIMCEKVVACLNRGRKILIAGNGGSASDAQHFAAELVCRMKDDRRALPAIALSSDTAILTAAGNDYGFEKVFSRQLEALGQEGDTFIALSTSGNSPNILEALKLCQQKNITSFLIGGKNGGKAASLANTALIVPHQDTSTIQECHSVILHTLCSCLESGLNL